jgi:spore germination protein YaaH
MSADSHELLWIERLSDLDKDSQKHLAAELAQREFMPEIQSIHQVSSFATPSTWQVTTDRGDADLVLKAEDHIRRLTQTSLLITDGHGINFLIRDLEQLDKQSRKLLDRFL